MLLNLHKSCHAFHAWLARLGDGKIKQIIWKFNEIHDRSNQLCFLRNNPKTTNTVACGFERQRVRWPLHAKHNFRCPSSPAEGFYIHWKGSIHRLKTRHSTLTSRQFYRIIVDHQEEYQLHLLLKLNDSFAGLVNCEPCEWSKSFSRCHSMVVVLDFPAKSSWELDWTTESTGFDCKRHSKLTCVCI